ncbi:phosphopyruvate hydratase [Gammaproteobacteria bacterium]|nr:phosphopyruvate hydratase [Gammaproteobacteria bacterium]
MKIKSIKGFEIIDSRGNPTVAATVSLEDGSSGTAFVPSGASTGQYEAIEKRDGDKTRYSGKGVLDAVGSIQTEIDSLLKGKNPDDLIINDQLMIDFDDTANKSNLGANSILAVSMASAKAAANSRKIPLYSFLNAKYSEFSNEKVIKNLPLPMMNILNGGAHADNPIDFQEFMIQPKGFSSFAESLRAGIEVFQTLKGILKSKGLSTSVGDEGGFAPNLKSPEEALDLIMIAIEKSGYKPGDQISLCLDIAATEFYSNSSYHLEGMKKSFTTIEMINYIKELCLKYPITSVEDGLDEDDWEGWEQLTESIGTDVQLVGDDLFVTNPERITKGVETHAANAVLVKVNQIGTLLETFDAIKTSTKNNFQTVISHRSGETEDTFIADLAVGVGSGQIKTGAPSRSDRVAKYNRLLMIEAETELCLG